MYRGRKVGGSRLSKEGEIEVYRDGRERVKKRTKIDVNWQSEGIETDVVAEI